MQKEVTFQTEEFVPAWASNYSEKKFSVFSTCFLSTKKNSHELNISEEVLRKCASSILGNFLVAKLQYGDATAHLPDEIIYGYFPKEQEIEFDTTEEGIVKAKAYCVISKMYGNDFNEIFSVQNLRNTSVEMSVSVSKEDEHEVLDFDIYALTCLGLTVNGSCPDAKMQMVRFDEQEAEEFFKNKENTNITEDSSVVDKEETRKEGESKMAEIEFAAVNIGDMWGKVYDALHSKYPDGDYGSVYRILDIYEDNGQKFAVIRHKDEDTMYRLDFTFTEDGVTLAEDIVKVTVEIVETDEIRKFAEPEDAEKYKSFAEEEKEKDEEKKDEAKMESTDDKEEDKKSEDEKKEDEEKTELEDPDPEKDEEKKAEMSAEEMKTEMARLQSEIEKRDNIIMEKDKEISELQAYRDAQMEAERAAKVQATMEKYASFMDEKTAKSFNDEGLQCDFAALDGWANKVAASVADTVIKQKGNKRDNEDFTRMSSVKHIEKDAEKAGTPLERLKNKYL